MSRSCCFFCLGVRVAIQNLPKKNTATCVDASCTPLSRWWISQLKNGCDPPELQVCVAQFQRLRVNLKVQNGVHHFVTPPGFKRNRISKEWIKFLSLQIVYSRLIYANPVLRKEISRRHQTNISSSGQTIMASEFSL